MSDIKTPYDSLRDYFDELLPSEDVAAIQSEYQETLAKAGAPLRAVAAANSMIRRKA